MPSAPQDVTARRPDERLSQWHERHRPTGKEVAWLQFTSLHLLVSFLGVALWIVGNGGLELGAPGILLAMMGLGSWNLLMLAPGTLVALSCDLGPFGWVRAVWLLGSLALAALFLPCLGRFGEAVLFVPVLVWPPLLFVLARPWR